jgi:Spy/CpxP family protein refolding chaperone
MTRNLHGVGRGWAVVASLVIGVALMALPSGAQDAPAAKPAAEKAAKVKKERKPSYKRLPANYGKVIDEKQREQIYAIQEEYGPKIEELKKQLETLTTERDEKVSAVLTPEQLQKIDDLKAEAKAKRAKSKKAEVEPEKETTEAAK